MASIANDPGGRKRILFVAGDGSRKVIRLGAATAKQAEAFKVKVEQLVSASILGHPPDDETSRWLLGLDNVIYNRLAAVGLVMSRQSRLLGAWIDSYVAERVDLRPRTRKTLRITKEKLVAFFGVDRAMRTITRDEASQWRAKLLADGLVEATVRLYSGNARQFFGEAARRDLIPKNVFDHLPAGAIPAKNERYVTSAEAESVLNSLDDISTYTVFALARFAGLRVPSETHALTWADVDWARGRLNVRAPKTERHAGHERRVVPITPRLMVILQKAFDAAPDGVQYVVSGKRSNQRIRELVLAAIKRAEVAPWEDLFRTLRSSCEREWAMTFPQYAVSKWLGHSIAVSGKHYANHVPDELFDKAAGTVGAAQNAAQQPAAGDRADLQVEPAVPAETAENTPDCGELRVLAKDCDDAVRTASTRPSSRPA